MADSGNDPLTLGSLEWETELDTVATDIASDPSTPTTALGPTESSTKAPPAKRARTTASGSKANNAQKKNTGLSKRKKGRLNILPTLPLDLLFEIFGHLTPADLVPLSRVSKSFYKVLSSRSSVSLWKRTWRNVPGGPPPQRPEGWSELAYARLLLGGNFCHVCGGRSTNEIDFVHLRRACHSCLRKTLVAVNKIKDIAPSLEVSWLSCLPSACVNPRDRKGRSYQGRFLREDDVLSLQAQIKDVLSGEQLMSILEDRNIILAALQRAAPIYVQWLKDHKMAWEKEREDRANLRRKEFEQRCIKLGYTAQDISSAHGYCNTTYKNQLLSDRGFDDIFNRSLKGRLENAKSSRLERERAEREAPRLSIVYALYAEYRLQLQIPPRNLEMCPKEYEFVQFTQIAPLISEDLAPDDEFRRRVRDAITESREEIEAWVVRLKTIALSSLHPAPSPCDTFHLPKELELAKNVFSKELSFDHKRAYYGIEVFSACWSFSRLLDLERLEVPTFDLQVQAVILKILAELGLDPNTTTTTDLNRLDTMFICLDCPCTLGVQNGGHTPRRRVRYWRSHLDHLLEMKSKYRTWGSSGSWRILTVEEHSKVINRGSDPMTDDPYWGCSHCNIHYSNVRGLLGARPWMKFEPVVAHVRDKHGVKDPLPDVDLYYDPRERFCAASELRLEILV